jgi:LAS superfamily LD-carboxypeptidase LdcB
LIRRSRQEWPRTPRQTARLVFLNILAALLVIAVLVTFIAWAARRGQESRRQRAEDGVQAQAALEGLQDLLDRHPDYGFERAAAQVEAFRRLSERELAPRRAEVEALKQAVDLEALSRATGHSPGGQGWQELRLYKTFSPNGFRRLYESLSFPRTRPISEPPAITGNPLADARIVREATSRGYRLRAEAEPEALAAYGRFQLQAQALEAFRKMAARAAAEGIRLELASGYRSVERQRAIFLAALEAEGRRREGRPYSPEELAKPAYGGAEAAIQAVLRESAPPGFSRHHTGYTVDLNDPSTGGDFSAFAASQAFRWLSASNYLNAKRFGFIPSYPEGATGQGPDPEPWEYTWVGEGSLRAAPAGDGS